MSDFYSSLFNPHSTCRMLRADDEIVVYGAGNTGHIVLRVLSQQGLRPLAFIDEYAKNKAIEGVPVVTLSDASLSRKATVIVAVFNRERKARFSEIEDSLLSAGYSSVLSFEQFYLSCPHDFPETFFWLADPRYLKDSLEEIREVDALWADTRSREIYRSQLLYRMTGDHHVLPDPISGCQYLPKDVPLLPDPYRFVDIGAFDGDTLAALKQQRVRLESVAAFEPDMRNFQALVKRVHTQGPFAPQTFLFPCGVGRACALTDFSGGGLESSKAVGGGQIYGNGLKVPIVSLDDILVGFRPNYIKFDVEGFEEAALCGLRKTIEKERPMLAVSAYHRPEDLFSLPLLLSSWNYPADYYLRMHMEHAFDTVLYTVPRG